ncbi:putative ribonuclease H-like domain-containing protein [Tanacetum coccineum]
MEDEVYVCQPPGFEDPDFPDRVYKNELCNAFEKLMHEKMSSVGELTFFLGLLVQQKKDGIFISQDKYVGEILKKFGFTKVKTASTPMETQKPLLKDEDGEEVDVHMYRYQVNPKVSHLHAVKRIFSDYAGASLDRKSTTGEAEYVSASSCCGQVLWIQNQLLDYRHNFQLLVKVNVVRHKLTTAGKR